jgi:predicted CXXCH cytochrome family protein
MRSVRSVTLGAGAALVVLLVVAVGVVLAQAKAVPHPVAGRENCLSCHQSAVKPVPADHAGRTDATCLGCHAAPSSGATPTGAPGITTPVATATGPGPTSPPPTAAAPTASPGASSPNEQCLACHAKAGQTAKLPGCDNAVSISVDGAQVAASVHGKAGLTCVSCHSTIQGYPHPRLDIKSCDDWKQGLAEACATCHSDVAASQKDSVHSRLSASGNGAAPTCVDCHSGHDVTPPDQPRSRLSQTCGQAGCHEAILTQYQGSVHGALLAKEPDNPYVPVCEDCHGVHQMADATTPGFLAGSPLICAKCHSDPNVISRYGLSTDVVQDFRDGIHSQLQLKDPSIHTPVCSECHGVHDVKSLRGSMKVSSETCSGCHTEIFAQYKSGVHGDALINGNNPDVPGCTSCHGAHKMPDPTTPQFRIGEPDLCARCHSDATMMNKYGLSSAVYTTYKAEFHGMTVELYQTKWANTGIYCYTAVCTDCHGTHEILSHKNPASTVAPANLINVCRKCHPEARPQFASAWVGHYRVSRDNSPLTYYVNLFYWILIPTVLGGMVLFIFTDIGRRIVSRVRRGKKT